MVSIPFEQGDVFRHVQTVAMDIARESQSLSSRAMSFDHKDTKMKQENIVSIPFEQGDVFRRDDQ